MLYEFGVVMLYHYEVSSTQPLDSVWIGHCIHKNADAL
jgi:hypothetical protein